MCSQIGHLFPVLAVAILLVGCGRDDSLLIEQQETAIGKLHGLKIGMDRGKVLKIAEDLGASFMNPIVCNRFRISNINVNFTVLKIRVLYARLHL